MTAVTDARDRLQAIRAAENAASKEVLSAKTYNELNLKTEALKRLTFERQQAEQALALAEQAERAVQQVAVTEVSKDLSGLFSKTFNRPYANLSDAIITAQSVENAARAYSWGDQAMEALFSNLTLNHTSTNSGLQPIPSIPGNRDSSWNWPSSLPSTAQPSDPYSGNLIDFSSDRGGNLSTRTPDPENDSFRVENAFPYNQKATSSKTYSGNLIDFSSDMDGNLSTRTPDPENDFFRVENAFPYNQKATSSKTYSGNLIDFSSDMDGNLSTRTPDPENDFFRVENAFPYNQSTPPSTAYNGDSIAFSSSMGGNLSTITPNPEEDFFRFENAFQYNQKPSSNTYEESPEYFAQPEDLFYNQSSTAHELISPDGNFSYAPNSYQTDHSDDEFTTSEEALDDDFKRSSELSDYELDLSEEASNDQAYSSNEASDDELESSEEASEDDVSSSNEASDDELDNYDNTSDEEMNNTRLNTFGYKIGVPVTLEMFQPGLNVYKLPKGNNRGRYGTIIGTNPIAIRWSDTGEIKNIYTVFGSYDSHGNRTDWFYVTA
jgi:hypothetical protein